MSKFYVTHAVDLVAVVKWLQNYSGEISTFRCQIGHISQPRLVAGLRNGLESKKKLTASLSLATPSTRRSKYV